MHRLASEASALQRTGSVTSLRLLSSRLLNAAAGLLAGRDDAAAPPPPPGPRFAGGDASAAPGANAPTCACATGAPTECIGRLHARQWYLGIARRAAVRPLPAQGSWRLRSGTMNSSYWRLLTGYLRSARVEERRLSTRAEGDWRALGRPSLDARRGSAAFRSGTYLEKSGSWYSYDGERIGQGREKARTFLKENPEVSAHLAEEVYLAKGLKVAVRADAESGPPSEVDEAGIVGEASD